MVRDKNNQLIYVAESTGIERFQTYLPNGILEPQWIDTIFDRTLMENYQSVIIYGKKYEKVQYQLTFENNFSCGRLVTFILTPVINLIVKRYDGKIK